METALSNWNTSSGNAMLYLLLLIFAVIAAANLGIAGNAARSDALPLPDPLSTEQSPSTAMPLSEAREADGACDTCGIVEAIQPVAVKRKGLTPGGVIGGVGGAMFGNDSVSGGGNPAATFVGATVGAHIGGHIDANIHKIVRYWVRVRMNDGTPRICYQFTAPTFSIGDLVRIVNGEIIAVG